MIRRCVGLALTALLGLACAGRGPFSRPPQATQEERRAYAEAVAGADADPAQAEHRLQEFLGRHPRGGLADDAGVALARLALERGDRDTARRRYEQVVRDHPYGDRADTARIGAAKLALAAGDAERARELLDRARLSRLSDDDRRDAARVRIDLTQDPVEKLSGLAQLRRLSRNDDAAALLDVEIDQLLLTLDGPTLEKAAGRIGRRPPAARVWLRVAELALEADDLAAARGALERAARLPLAPAYGGRLSKVGEALRLREEGPVDVAEIPTFAEVLRHELPSTRGARGTIGVVLPLSGRFAPFGEESLQGLLLAAGIFGERSPDDPDVRVVVRDSAGRPERAAEAVRDLAERENVVAIVGPLLKGECEAAAAAAEAAGVPLIALTAREEIARDRPHVFRVRTKPIEEAQLLADYAIEGLGARRFAILYPRDSYGRGLRALFWDAVEVRGGSVVGVASYDPEATDFAEPIRRLVGYVLLTPKEHEALGEREKMLKRARRLPPDEALALRQKAMEFTAADGAPIPPIVDFDALFIPESHEKVVLIAPQLAFHEATGITLLGPQGWYAPDLVEIGRTHVEGAHFTAYFYPDSPIPYVREFAERFQAGFGRPAGVFAAQGYDAANLVLVQLARGIGSRPGVRDGILYTRAFPGVTGVMSMRPDGNASKRPFLLGVERGRITQIEQGVAAPR